MTSYYIMYLIPSLMALISIREKTKNNKTIWLLIGILFTFLIGYRFEVGGDWVVYLGRLDDNQYSTLREILEGKDPGYYLINYFMHLMDWGIYGVNLICGAIFMMGLIIFARKQYSPWLAFSVAIPYLIVVVGMGYTRQAVAIGLVFWAIVALNDKKFFWFLILVTLAATFHKSAVLMIGIGMFGQGTGKLLRVLAIGFVGFGIYDAFLSEHQEALWKNYVEAQMESQGAKVRVLMNLVPALLFFVFRKEWKALYDDYGFWRIIAVGSIASIFIVDYASTAVDRVALYMIPIQLVVFGRLPLLAKKYLVPKNTTLLVVLYYAFVLFVWLNFATHAEYWLPYQNYLFYDLF